MSSVITDLSRFPGLTVTNHLRFWGRATFIAFAVALCGCEALPKQEADAQQVPREARQGGAITVDVAIAQSGSLEPALEYTGTTAPIQQVSVRSQIEGKILTLNVDIGDPVSEGEVIARIDDTLSVAATLEAEAELTAREVEVNRAQNQVREAQTRVEQARLELQQAQADADRLQMLLAEGAIARQQAEQAVTAAETAEQLLLSATSQVRTQQKAVTVAQQRVIAQQAVVDAARERQTYSVIQSPLSGTVLERVSETGNIVQSGDEILKIGDLSLIKIVVEISELELGNLEVGQPVQVRLDAFPDQEFSGELSRISPAADPNTRLVPVEITIANRNGRLGSGLLARVAFASNNASMVVIPQTALAEKSVREGDKATVFVTVGEGEETKVAARSVTVGEQADGKVEIRSGLSEGDRFVTRSSKPLKDGDTVKLSVISQ